MFKSKRSGLTGLCAMLVLSVLLTGCGALYHAGVPDYGPQEIGSQVTEIKFSWWGNDKRHAYTMDGVDTFQRLNPDVKVACRYGVWQGYEKRNQVWMLSRTEADVMQINFSWLSAFSDDGEGYYDLYKLADVIDLSNFREEDLKYGVKNGKLNALPIAFNTPEFFYVQEVWDKYNLPVPADWSDFENAAAVMKADHVYPIGMVKKMIFMFMIAHHEQMTGEPAFDDSGELLLTEQDLADMLEQYVTWVNDGVMCSPDEFNKDDFTKGLIACTMCWVSDAGNYCSGVEENGMTTVIGGQFIHPGAQLSGWYIKPATLIAISRHTNHPEESARLVDFLLNSPEMAVLQGSEKGVPVSRSALETLKGTEGGLDGYESRAAEYMTEHMSQMSVIKPVMENDDIISAFKSYADDYKYGADTLENCAKNLRRDIVAAIEDTN